MKSNFLCVFALYGVLSLAGQAQAATIWLDADPGGTTSNVNVQQAVYNSGTGQVTDWGTYRDYRFQLEANPQVSVADFALRLSVNKSSSFSAPLNVTWFADSITPYAALPDFQTALGTVSASDLPTGSFAPYVVGPGPFHAPLTIPAVKTAYWVRIWAATSGGADKYQVKVAPNADLEYVSSASNVTMYDYDGTSFSATPAAQTTNINPVPEPANWSGALMAVVCDGGFWGRRRQKRRAA